MRDVPRELTVERLAELFEGRTRFVERLAAEPDPLTRARALVHELPLDEKREILAAHPAIGQRTGLSARSAAEQGSDADPAVLEELARLNADYEARHGFRFVVFVNRRPKAEIFRTGSGSGWTSACAGCT
jgi:2-oxo-4-hydroxy-4-carboxy--5-ureidoimidazoline (OHCU) decarboxylase